MLNTARKPRSEAALPASCRGRSEAAGLAPAITASLHNPTVVPAYHGEAMRRWSAAPRSFAGLPTRRAALLVAVALVCIALSSAAYPTLQGFLVTSVDPGTPPPSVPELTDDERAYYDFVAPRLRELSAQTQALSDAAASKSRNLVDIRVRGERVRTLVREINEYADDAGAPERFTAVAAAYRAGAGDALVAMREAQQGFLRLDWDRVAAAVPRFADGTAQFDAAIAEIERVGSQAAGFRGTPRIP